MISSFLTNPELTGAKIGRKENITHKTPLIIRLHSLGDVVLASSAARYLARSGDVAFLTKHQYAPLVNRMGAGIRPISVSPDDGCFSIFSKNRILFQNSRIFDLQGNLTSIFATVTSRPVARFRINRMKRAEILKNKSSELLYRGEDFLSLVGGSENPAPFLERRSAQKKDAFTVGIVTGGRWLMKSIPEDVIEECIRIITDKCESKIILAGEGQDMLAARKIAQQSGRKGVAVYTGKNGIESLILLIEQLDLLISPDSGPAHIAAALGVPVLVIFTSTAPSLGFWLQDRSRYRGVVGYYSSDSADCSPCHKHGGNRCRRGDEICRKSILPIELVSTAMDMVF